MSTSKETRLKAKGWRSGSVQDFLGLTDGEAAYIELKHQLAKKFRKQRKRCRLTQVETAKLLKSSQSRVAKMEASDPAVSIDMLWWSLFRLGASVQIVSRPVRRSA